MRRARVAWTAALVVMVTAVGASGATRSEWKACQEGEPDARIAACTLIIGERGISRADRGSAYASRGGAYSRKNDRNLATADYNRAITEFDAAIRLNPEDALTFFNRGAVHFNKGDYERAIADYDVAIRLKPKYADAYKDRADAHAAKGDHERAIPDFDEAIRLDPKNADAYFNRGQSYVFKGSYDRAIADFDAAIRLNPRNHSAYFGRAQAYGMKDDDDRTITDFEAARLIDPDGMFGSHYALRAYIRRGEARAAKGNHDQAISDYDAAIRLGPNTIRFGDWDFGRAYTARGDAFVAKRDYDRAIADYDIAIKLDPEAALVFNSRGVAIERKGDRARAIADYRHALSLPERVFVVFAGGERSNTVRHDNREAHSRVRANLSRLGVPQTVPSRAAPSAVASARRIALVIGNSAYAHATRLPNPPNDAQALAAALRRLGFTVTEAPDLDYAGFRAALKSFGDDALTADWAIAYYAGHGIEIGGANYLIPVDARLARDTHIADETVPLDDIVKKTQGARALRVVILDACRDNPFKPRMTWSAPQARSTTRGLARPTDMGSTLVVFAAQEGQVADDGSGQHSPFTAAMLAHLETPRLEVGFLLRRVTADVRRRTGDKQIPTIYGTLSDEQYVLKPE